MIESRHSNARSSEAEDTWAAVFVALSIGVEGVNRLSEELELRNRLPPDSIYLLHLRDGSPRSIAISASTQDLLQAFGVDPNKLRQRLQLLNVVICHDLEKLTSISTDCYRHSIEERRQQERKRFGTRDRWYLLQQDDVELDKVCFDCSTSEVDYISSYGQSLAITQPMDAKYRLNRKDHQTQLNFISLIDYHDVWIS